MNVAGFAERVRAIRERMAAIERQVAMDSPSSQALLSDARELLDTAIAELTEAEAALDLSSAQLQRDVLEQREWFRVTLTSIGDAVIVADTSGHVTFMNLAAQSLTGWASEEAIGRPLGEVFRIVSESSHSPVEDPVAHVLASGTVVGLANHTILVARDGTERPIDDSGTPIKDDQGNIVGVILVFRDMSEHVRLEADVRESRDQLAAILRGVADGVTVQDHTGRLVYANDTAAQLIGYPSAEALLATPLGELLQRFEVMDEAGQPFPLDRLPGRLVLQGAEDAEAVLRFRTLAASVERWSIVKAAPILDAHGQVRFAINTFHEITALKQAEAELQEQRERFAVTLASIGDAVIATDTAGRVTFMNPVAEALTGWSSAEAHGRDSAQVFRILDEETRQPLESPIAQVLREGLVVGLANHTVLIARGGAERPIDDSGAPIRSADGTIGGVVLVFRDVTERRRAQRELERTNQLLRTIVEASPLSIVVLDRDGNVELWNPAAERIFGWRADEVLGQRLPTVPADKQDEFQANLARETTAGQETRRQRKGGGPIDVDLWVAPLYDDRGVVRRVINVVADITQRKRAEQALRFLASAGAVLASSLDYATTLTNLVRLAVPTLADYCTIHIVEDDGRAVPVQAVHTNPAKQELLWQLLHHSPPDRDATTPAALALRTGESQLVSETDMVPAQADPHDEWQIQLIGALAPRSSMVVPLRARGRTLGIMTLAASESGRRYTSEDLDLAEELGRRAALAVDNARLYREAQRAIRLRDQFLSIASHELKTPLTSLLGNVQLLQRRARRDGSLSQRDSRTVDVIAEQANRLSKMVAALLDISRIEQGQLSIARNRVDLCALAERVVAEVQPTLAQHSVECRAPSEQLLIHGDELRLEQVLQNLIQNAIKYSPAGGPIVVRVERRDWRACLDVIDQGIGIPHAALPQLFQRFYRAPNAEAQHISGMGIGLYVVREIVELHGGEVVVESTEGQGSRFSVCLPLHEQSNTIPETAREGTP